MAAERTPPVDGRTIVDRIYAAYNRRDAEALLALVADDVDWPDDPDGPGRLRGKAALRRYWERQWARARTRDDVLAVAIPTRDQLVVQIGQVVHAPDGAVLSTGQFEHRYRIEHGLIVRLEIRRA